MRIANEQFGFRLLYNRIVPVGNRRIATRIALLHNDVEVGNLTITELRIAPELSDKDFTPTQEQQRMLDALTTTGLLMLPSDLMLVQMRSIDAHLLPAMPSDVRGKQHYAIARLLLVKAQAILTLFL